MLKVDSFKMSIPIEAVNTIAFNQFEVHKTTKNKGSHYETYQQSHITTGINSIEVRQTTGEIILQGSAKCLKNNYLDLISLNNIEQVFSAAGSTGLIQFNIPQAIEQGVFLSLDPCKHIDTTQAGYTKKEAYNVLNTVPIGAKYQRTGYNTKHNLGVVFKGDQKSQKFRLIAYDKSLDLQAGKNKNFISNISNLGPMLNEVRNQLRFEQNITSFAAARTRLHTMNNTIQSILNTAAEPVSKLFTQITTEPSAAQLQLFENDNMTLIQLERYWGMKHIIETFNYNENSIKEYLKHKLQNLSAKSFQYHWYHRYKPMIKVMQVQGATIENSRYLSILNSIKQMLAA